ncbi:hypothetical protein VE00_07303 [Pseudogymnoascus sp. WSF 3629]|nr:hypothetical protein VE00_07303 [Pseudogymnoascus sp. WSF 3629]
MVHLYACTICKNKIPADENRIHCSDCGSEICGSCYLRKKTSHFHELDHTNYMMAEASGSMYVRPPAPPMLAAPKANNTKKKAKQAATPQTRAGVKRKHPNDDHAKRPAGAPPIISGHKRKFFGRTNKICARCRKHHQRCSGPTEEGWCERCRKMDYPECDFGKDPEDGIVDEEASSGLSSSWSRSSAAPEPTKSTPSLGGRSENPSVSKDRESSSSESPQPATRRRLVSRRNMPAYVFDE